MLAVFGIGGTELLILAIIGGMICFPLLIAIVVVTIVVTRKNRPRN